MGKPRKFNVVDIYFNENGEKENRSVEPIYPMSNLQSVVYANFKESNPDNYMGVSVELPNGKEMEERPMYYVGKVMFDEEEYHRYEFLIPEIVTSVYRKDRAITITFHFVERELGQFIGIFDNFEDLPEENTVGDVAYVIDDESDTVYEWVEGEETNQWDEIEELETYGQVFKSDALDVAVMRGYRTKREKTDITSDDIILQNLARLQHHLDKKADDAVVQDYRTEDWIKDYVNSQVEFQEGDEESLEGDVFSTDGSYDNLRAGATTKTDVGLGNVENHGIADQEEAETGSLSIKYMTPLRTYQSIQKNAPDPDLSEYDDHIADTTNPHSVTADQTGAAEEIHTHTESDVTDLDKYDTATVDNKLSDKADLEEGQVPNSQLPSYVSEIERYDTFSLFPTTGDPHIIYKDREENKLYRWDGESYVVVADTLVLGETSETAYRGDRGKEAYDHSNVTSGNPHSVNKSDVGLGNVLNYGVVDQAEAESGTANDKYMTPLRTYQSIQEHTPSTPQHIVGDTKIPESEDLYTYQIENKMNTSENIHTIFEVKSPEPADGFENEATVTLMREKDKESGGPEFIDFFNNGYDDSRVFGMRMQARGTGVLRPFRFEFNDGSGITEALTIEPTLVNVKQSIRKTGAGFNALEFFNGDTKTGHVGRLSDRANLFNAISGTAIDLFDDGLTQIYQPSKDFNIYLDVGAFRVNDKEPQYRQSGLRSERPSNPPIGTFYFETDYDIPVWYNGTEWVDNDVSEEYAKGVIETNNLNNMQIWQGTQTEYDAITTPDANIIYFIEDE